MRLTLRYSKSNHIISTNFKGFFIYEISFAAFNITYAYVITYSHKFLSTVVLITLIFRITSNCNSYITTKQSALKLH